MKHQEKITEVGDAQLLALIDSKETGVSFPDALRALPTPVTSEEDTRALKAVWDIHGNLMREAHNISPSSALLSRILEQAGTAIPIVTRAGENGYIKEGGNTRLNSIPSLLMGMNWKIEATIVVMMIAVMSVLGGAGSINTVANPDSQDASPTTLSLAGNEASDKSGMAKSESVRPVAPTLAMRSITGAPRTMGTDGIIDEFSASIIHESERDLTLLADSTGDIALIAGDSQSINEFNTVYDETTF